MRLKTRSGKAATVLALAAGLALAGCGGDHNAHETGAAASPTASSTVGARANAADEMFAVMMIPHHEQAVEMADLVPTRTTNTDLLALAAEIKDAQQPEITQMQGWLKGWGTDVAAMGDHASHGGMAGMQSDEAVAELAALEDDSFDRRWMEMMIDHHEGAVTMAKDVIAKGSDPAVRALAEQVITAQQAEIAQMTGMLGG